MTRFNHLSAREHCYNLYYNAARFHWPATQVDKYRADYLAELASRKVTIRDREYVRGLLDAFDLLHWRKLVFSYEVDGIRYTLGSEEYSKLDPMYVNKFTDTGAYVYKDDPTKFFTLPKEANVEV